MHRSFIAILAVLLGILISSLSFGSQVYVGPSDSNGHFQMTAPTEEEMQMMAETRLEKHACMQKSTERLAAMREANNPLVATVYPTSNMYDYDVLYYKIDISISMSGETVGGYVEMHLKSLIDGLSYVDLTLANQLNVTATRLDGVSQAFWHSTDILTVNFTTPLNDGDEFTLKVEYDGYPSTSDGLGMFFYSYSGRRVCYTNCEPWGARNWWPCKDFTFDKPDSANIIITHPTTYGGYTMDLVSNGLRQSVTDNGNGTTTTHWLEKHPIATYLVALVLTDFNQTNQSWEYAPGEFMPVEHNYYPTTSPSDSSYSTYYMVNYTLPALDALSYYWGLYPFWDEKYGHMHFGWGGAMEHQTCTSISPTFNTEYVIAHELAHQWSGDQVTCAPVNHMWINEGFASYAEVLYFEYHYGSSYAKTWLSYQEHINAGTPYVEDLETDNVFDGTTVYDKGSWLVHMLRNQMGDDLFFPAMQDFFLTSEFAGGSASTDDLNSVVSQYYGSDMSWFFDTWVYQEGQPDYRYSYDYEPDTILGTGYFVYFILEQQNMDGVFPMHVDIVAHAGDYDSAFTIWNTSEVDVYTFNLPNPPTSFEIDPDDKILKTAGQVPFSMHIASPGRLPDAVLGEPYSYTLQAIGGVPDYTWQKTLGQFPVGMTFNGTTGVLSGTPTWVADYFFRLRCTDSDSPPKVDERAFTLAVVEESFPRGDCDGSGEIDIDDVVYLIAYIFSGGPAPDPLESGDVDCSTEIDIDDVVYLIEYIFTGGPAPCM
ncbi:MAG: hypothetical protein KKG33_08930 [candidate division Zixibacteria bacterium]|nr:hypothetical protein [candidate division Zixibacteria bacterium]MBU1472133.1 hypothetical protein [candidate division Zixibacteria bacterium]MBU2625672.1 hypothetical protein [candidate division Zixibacteria bacterium]